MSLLIELLPSAGPALVVGGGEVAGRKVRDLRDAGFALTVVSPEISEEIASTDGADLVPREFRDEDVDGFALVFACTNSRAVNRRVGQAARRHGLPVVVADSQDESTFFTPAAHRDGGLTVAVSTGGASPGMARDLRNLIAERLGPGWAEKVQAARRERRDKASGLRDE